MTSVLITFKASDDERRALGDVLGDVASLVYLADVAPAARSAALTEATVLIAGNFAREIDRREFNDLGHLRLIQTIPAGVDGMPFAQIPPGVMIASNAGAFAQPIAEHVMAMVLALAKNLLVENDRLRDGEFDRVTLSRSLAGMNAGIIGFGGIGRATARLMRCFDMAILAVNQTGRSTEPAAFVGTLDDLEHVLRESDVVVLSLPLTDQTHNIIRRRQLDWMKPDSILINVARGNLVDEEALYEHARGNPGFLVGLDVWWDEPFAEGRFRSRYPLLELPNVVGSPHNSGHVPGIMLHATRVAAENVRRLLAGERPSGIVDPAQYLPSVTTA